MMLKLAPFGTDHVFTGMRPSEGAGLVWGQIDIDARIIDLTVTKTKPRRVSLTIQAVEILVQSRVNIFRGRQFAGRKAMVWPSILLRAP